MSINYVDTFILGSVILLWFPPMMLPLFLSCEKHVPWDCISGLIFSIILDFKHFLTFFPCILQSPSFADPEASTTIT